MSFRKRIKYYLVHHLSYTNKDAQRLIDDGLVHIDGAQVCENSFLEAHSEIKVDGIIQRHKKRFVYYRFYKPVGYECSLNKKVEANLSGFFEDHGDLAIAGRLDRLSEGLLLLSNNGKWVERVCNPKYEKEKEYEVTLNKFPDPGFIASFSGGVKIGSYITDRCRCEPIGGNEVKVILKEGKNRQIRRMCVALGYSVVKLKRTRVDSVRLDNLVEGEKSDFIPDP